MLDMLGQTVVTPSESEATIKADELERLANELGVNKRRLEEWRARGLIPRPALAGYEGKRPVWVYPARAAKQLRAIVRLRKNTRDLDAIRAALWAQGYPVPTEAVRSSLLTVIDRFEQAMVRDLARFTPEGMTVTDLQHDPDALRAALVAYADELARRRSRSPLTRKVRMSAAERQRGMFYMLAPFFDQPRDEADAILAERLYGISRGRSGTARGALELPPSEHFPRNPLTADVLRAGVEAADDRTFAFVGAMLHSFLTLMPALLPILVPADSELRSFVEDAIELFKDPPAHAIALLASAFIANTHRRRSETELTEELVDAVQVSNLFSEIFNMLGPEQRRQLTGKTTRTD
jgi:MerR HTH family regulatory protein